MHHTSAVAGIVGGIVMLLLLAAAILALTKRLRLPYSVILVLVGIGLATITAQSGDTLPILKQLAISPDLILYVFLPTLIFESSLNLDIRQLRQNIAPIATLAIPGLLLSTTLIGYIVHWLTPIPLLPALLLGAILSATDPVAVMALFKQLGAPQRLGVLVEGESLFNDATSIVLARILIGVIAAGTLDSSTLSNGLLDFFILFFGGLLTGILLGGLTASLLGLVESDSFIEITLTTVLAYASFLLAEELLGVSGVMATVGAGLTLGGWGRSKISPSVRIYLEHFWEQMAFIANALIFLMLGLKVDHHALWNSLDLLPWVIIAMLLARAAIIYTLMPLVGRLPGSKPVGAAYQGLMFWGGLRGAIAVAIVLSLPHFEYAETFVALVMGAVLFTLLVQGLTIEPLMKWLKLDQPPLPDRLALLERDLIANKEANTRINELLSGGLFSAPLARRLQHQCHAVMQQTKQAIQTLRQSELEQSYEIAMLYLRALSKEKSFYDRMYANGHLSEGAYRELTVVLILQIDAIRFHGAFEHIHSHRMRRRLEKGLYRLLEHSPQLAILGERLRMKRIIRNYEQVWGHHQASGRVIQYLTELQRLEAIPAQVIDEVLGHYRQWHHFARQQLDLVSENFPEMVSSMQERLGKRTILLAQLEATASQMENGLLPKGIAETQIGKLNHQLNLLRGETVEKLKIEPLQLLQKVPLFMKLNPEVVEELATMIHPHTVEAGSTIIAQGDSGDSLYLIARGVVRVSHHIDGEEHELGTLMAGDFFGEMALMHHEDRTASIRSVSPCMLYELKGRDFDQLLQAQPQIAATLRETDARRREMQEGTPDHLT
jgi:CPA1 family monovalent cation:H+ antiporter